MPFLCLPFAPFQVWGSNQRAEGRGQVFRNVHRPALLLLWLLDFLTLSLSRPPAVESSIAVKDEVEDRGLYPVFVHD